MKGLVPGVRLERTTYLLQGGCSTIGAKSAHAPNVSQYAEGPALGVGYMGGEAGRVPVAGVAGDTAEAGGGDEHVGFMVVGFARELRGPAAESGQCLIEGVEAADLAAAKAGEADEEDRKSTRLNSSH